MNDDRTHGDHSAVDDGGDADGTVAVSANAALSARLLRAICDPGNILGETKPPEQTLTTWQLRAVNHVLETDGWVVPGIPPARQVLSDARQFSDELVLIKGVVARCFRTFILSGVTVPDIIGIMDWLRDYNDGTLRGHGPLGKPMIWPEKLPTMCALLRDWGFQPTPSVPAYVSKKPGPAANLIDLSTMGDAFDPRSVEPLDPRREMNLGSLLDETTKSSGAMAFTRADVLRAMSAAFDKGATHFDAAPIYPALVQLRDHQTQANQDGSMVTVSRQAIDEVVAHLSGEPTIVDVTDIAGEVYRLLGEPDDHGCSTLSEDASRSEIADVLAAVHERLTGYSK